MQRRGFCPALDSLLASDGLHKDAQEIGGVVAVFQNLWFDFSAGQARAIEQFASEPVIEQGTPVFQLGEVAEAKADQIEGIAFGVINGESSRRKKSVIEQLGSGTSTAEDEHGRF